MYREICDEAGNDVDLGMIEASHGFILAHGGSNDIYVRSPRLALKSRITPCPICPDQCGGLFCHTRLLDHMTIHGAYGVIHISGFRYNDAKPDTDDTNPRQKK